MPDEMRGTFPSHPKYLPLIRAITEEGAALSFALTAGLGFGALASYALVAAMQQ